MRLGARSAATTFTGRSQTDRLSRLLLNAAVDELNADSAADADPAVAAATAVDANVPAVPVTPGGASPGTDLVIMAWVMAQLAPLIALILIILVGGQRFAAKSPEGSW